MVETARLKEGCTRDVAQVVVLDLDRCMVNVDASMERFKLSAEHCGLVNIREQVDTAQKKVENDGGSFDPMPLIPAFVKEKFGRHFVSQDSDLPPILYPDAKLFIVTLRENSMPTQVRTYGVNPLWQRLKVLASGYEGAMTILNHTKKGKEIASWKVEGKYIFPVEPNGTTIRADSVVLFDDKATSFDSLPEDCAGFLVMRDETKLPSQQGTVRPNIRTIRSFDELEIVNGKINRASIKKVDVIESSVVVSDNKLGRIVKSRVVGDDGLPFTIYHRGLQDGSWSFFINRLNSAEDMTTDPNVIAGIHAIGLTVSEFIEKGKKQFTEREGALPLVDHPLMPIIHQQVLRLGFENESAKAVALP